MQNIFTIKELAKHANQTVTIQGWLQGKRSSGKIAFLLIRDGTGTCQCVVEAQHSAAFAEATAINLEGSLTVTGVVRPDPRSPGGYEIAATAVKIIQSQEGYPISRKEHGIDFLLEHRHLWLRSPRQTTILRIRHTIIKAIRDFFDSRGFTLVDSPILTPGAAEGSNALFNVDYFGETVHLSESGQLYLESACQALGKVYCFGPTFRAEKSKTRRHLAEFWMVEPEVAFLELPGIALLAEEFILHIVTSVLANHRADLQTLGRDLAPLEAIKAPFPRLTYSEAVDLLHSDEIQRTTQEKLAKEEKRLQERRGNLKELEEKLAGAKLSQKENLAAEVQELREEIRDFETDLRNRRMQLEGAKNFRWGDDLGGDEETILSRHYDRPLIVMEYPRRAKAFYMKEAPHDPRVVLNLDILAPEGYGEIIGGSQREDNLAALEARMAEEKMDPRGYEWYLDLRRYGSVPHGGFGLGVERTIAWICGMRHIREAIPFPRLMGRIYP